MENYSIYKTCHSEFTNQKLNNSNVCYILLLIHCYLQSLKLQRLINQYLVWRFIPVVTVILLYKYCNYIGNTVVMLCYCPKLVLYQLVKRTA